MRHPDQLQSKSPARRIHASGVGCVLLFQECLEAKLQGKLDCTGVIGGLYLTKVACSKVGADALASVIHLVAVPLRVIPHVEE